MGKGQIDLKDLKDPTGQIGIQSKPGPESQQKTSMPPSLLKYSFTDGLITQPSTA